MMDEKALVLELRQVRTELAELLDDHRRLQRRLLRDDDRSIGRVVVPLMGEVLGPGVLPPGELMNACAARRDAVGQAVLETIRDADLVDSDGSWRALGRLFSRIEGIAFDGYRLASEGRRGWRVVAVSSP
jgi:hypothetical protein